MQSKKKHIFHIRDSSGIFGAERVILTLAKNIDREKFVFTLLCLRRNDGRSERLISAARNMGVKVVAVDVNGRFDLAAISNIRKILSESSADIIHSHDFKSDFYALLATRGTRVKRVATAHGSTKDSFLKKAYLFFNERVVYFFFDSVVAVSKDLSEQLIKRGISNSKIKVIQNGLDFSLLENEIVNDTANPPIVIPEHHKIFAVIGRLFPDKGHRYFLDAFSAVKNKYPRICGLIVGDGPSFVEIQADVERRGLRDSIIMCGVRSDMKAIYALTDFLVIPSLREGLPYVLLEAMASRVPVVATTVGDIPLLIRDGETGCLVPPGDENALTRGMLNFMASPEHAKKMAEEAFDDVHRKFSAEMMVAETEKLYQEL